MYIKDPSPWTDAPTLAPPRPQLEGQIGNHREHGPRSPNHGQSSEYALLLLKSRHATNPRTRSRKSRHEHHVAPFQQHWDTLPLSPQNTTRDIPSKTWATFNAFQSSDSRNSYTGLHVCMLMTITRYGFEPSCLILGQCSQSNEPPYLIFSQTPQTVSV